MKILFVQDSLGTGGAERSNAELWYFLKEKGISIKIIVLDHRHEGVQQEILNKGFDVVFLKPGNFLGQSKNIAEIIKDYRPDLVQSVLFRATMRVRAAKLFAKFYHLESLVSCPYDEVRFQDAQINSTALKLYKFFDQISESKGTDRFVAITEEVKNHYIQKLKIPAKKIEVIYRGRKKNAFLKDKEQVRNKLRDALGIKQNDLVFVHVGRQEFAKGHINLLEAIAKVDHELAQYNVRFIFCGRKGNATKEIEDFLENKKIQTELKFLGHRNDIYEILVASDVFVFPSLYEGLGGALIEAQAAGLPVICSDIKVFREVVNINENALFFEKNNTSELGDCLTKMAKSQKLRFSMGVKSVDNYNRKFQIEKIHSQMLGLYQQITD
ncbi:MAG TPA: glycosyltransferase family 4 protein [Salinimicrobium sp.]|nr:glycosyltransferase family 4 protein [Salinimicrobium sp.]